MHKASVITDLHQAVKAGVVESFSDFSKKASKLGSNLQHKIKGSFEMGSQFHFSLEPQSCVCVPVEDGLDVYSATQWMDATQIAIAEALNLPNNLVNMHVRRLGGGFGGKISRATWIACAAAIAAHHLNRPVRFVMTIESNMASIGKRYACINDYQVEIDNNGKIQKLVNDYVEDYGSSYNEPAFLTTAFLGNCYESESFEVIAKKAKTNTASNTWCRAPGTLEGIAMIENIMEHIARKVKKDPLEVRLSNVANDSEMKKLLPEFAESVGEFLFVLKLLMQLNIYFSQLAYRERKSMIDAFNTKNRWIKRGIAITPMKFHVEYFGTLNAFISVYHRDGSVAVTVGGIEMGQGLNTKVAQTVAHVLGIPMEKISIKPSNSLTNPNAIVTGGGIGSEISCFVISLMDSFENGLLNMEFLLRLLNVLAKSYWND